MRKILERTGVGVAGALALAVILIGARAVRGGPLDPPGPVGSTMRTLGDLVPIWDQTLSSSGGCSSQRFSCVLGGGAVLDNETGLVWSMRPYGALLSWNQAMLGCQAHGYAGRHGWRLPTAPELMSLLDSSVVNPALSLPAGHPFVPYSATRFWTASTDENVAPGDVSERLVVEFLGQAPGNSGGLTSGNRDFLGYADAWCVRGAVTQ